MILQEWLRGGSSKWIQPMHSVRRCRPRRFRSIAYADTFHSQDVPSSSGIRAEAGIAEGHTPRARPDAEAPRRGPGSGPFVFRGGPCLCVRWRGAGQEGGGDSSKATSGACAAASSQARGSGACAKDSSQERGSSACAEANSAGGQPDTSGAQEQCIQNVWLP